MTCSEVGKHLDQAVESGSTALPVSVREHLGECPACRELWDFLTRREAPEGIPASLQQKITDVVIDSLEPVKPLAHAWKLVVGFVLIFVVIPVGFVAGSATHGPADMGLIPFTVILGLVGLGVLLSAITLSREMAPGSPRLLSPAGLFLGLLAALFAAVALLFPWQPNPDFLPRAWECFRAGIAFSIPAAVLTGLLLRRGAVLSMEVGGAGAGMLSGLVGITVLHLACPIYEAPHVALGHVGVALTGVLAGFFLGRFFHHRAAGTIAGGGGSEV